MLHIDTVLLLQHDKSIRRQLLSLALSHTQTDLIALRNAIDNGDKNAALHHTHQAKGTASFLGVDQQILRQFDQLTHALCQSEHQADQAGSCAPPARPATSPRGQSSGSESSDATTPAHIELAFKPVAAILQALETSLHALIQEQEEP